MFNQSSITGLQQLAELSFQDRCRIVSPDFSGLASDLNIVEERPRDDLSQVDLITCRYLPKSSDKLLGDAALGELTGVLFLPTETTITPKDTIAIVTINGVDLPEPLLFDVMSEPEIGHVQLRVPLTTTKKNLPTG